jgi:hypothetical protein
MRLPAQAARQLPNQSTSFRVDSSSTDELMRCNKDALENRIGDPDLLALTPNPTFLLLHADVALASKAQCPSEAC